MKMEKFFLHVFIALLITAGIGCVCGHWGDYNGWMGMLGLFLWSVAGIIVGHFCIEAEEDRQK